MIAQEQLDAKTRGLYTEVDSLVDLIRSSVQEMPPLHVVEENVFDRVLAIGRKMRWTPGWP